MTISAITTVYHLLKKRVQHVDIGAAGYELQQRQREVDARRRRATRLGFALTTSVQDLSA